MIVITAPTSSIGKKVLTRLLDSYPDVRVIARDPSGIEPADKWTGAGHQAVLSPEDLSFEEMASVMTAVLGQSVQCVRTGYAAYGQQFIRRGWSEAMAQGQVDMVRAKSEGLDNGEARTGQNTAPTSFRQWCETVLRPAVAG